MDFLEAFGIALDTDAPAFRVLSQGRDHPLLYPVRHPRPTPREGLVGLESPLGLLRKNLECLHEGLSPVSTLVHGFRGTGKTSMVLEAWRQINARHTAGGPPFCRLVQIDRDGIPHLLPLVDTLGDRKEAFLLFFDDLYFPTEDPNFHQFRAFLDGGIASLPTNVGLVVTSNHRHLISESFSRRDDALHPGETRDDSLALWDRFGLTLTVTEPSLEVFLDMVIAKCLSRKILPPGTVRPVSLSEGTLGPPPPSHPPDTVQGIMERARLFAMRRASRSGRTAQWFVDLLERGLLDHLPGEGQKDGNED